MPTKSKRLLDQVHKHRIHVKHLQKVRPDFYKKLCSILSPIIDIHQEVFIQAKIRVVSLALDPSREARSKLAMATTTLNNIDRGYVIHSGDYCRYMFEGLKDGELSRILWVYQSWAELRRMRVERQFRDAFCCRKDTTKDRLSNSLPSLKMRLARRSGCLPR